MYQKANIKIMLVGIIGLLALVWIAIAAFEIQPSNDPLKIAPEVGSFAPDFTLKTLEGGEISLSELRGKAVLINFWATWCAPCRVETPELVNAYNANKDNGVVILGIDLTYADSIETVQSFVDEFKIPYPILLDEIGTTSNQDYRLRGLPMSVFVDRDGVITRIHIGLMTREQIDEYVSELLN